MKIHRNFDKVEEIRNAVVTTGSFDGVHVGHKVIIDRLKELAKEINGQTVLITFYPHPRKVLYPETSGKDLKLISSQQEKIELLRKAGIDHLIVIEFTKDFACTTSKDFTNKILLGKLRAKIIIVGFNHHFGHNREGDYNYLYELTARKRFRVEEIPEQDIQNESVSSTKIRKAIHEGNIGRANAYLDHQYIVIGEMMPNTCAPVKGFLPYCIDIEEEEKLTPPAGIYAVSIRNKAFYSKGFVYLANSEKFKYETAVLLHTFDSSSRFLGQEVTIFFHKKIREDIRFDTHEELLVQLERDKAEVEELIY